MYNKKILLITICLLFPLATYASWWNPFTWKIFQRNQEQTISNTVSSSTVTNLDTDLISCNNFKYNKCPVGQKFICPDEGKDGYCIVDTDTIKTPVFKEEGDKVNNTNSAKEKVNVETAQNYQPVIISLVDSVINAHKNNINSFKEIIDKLTIRRDKVQVMQNKLSANQNKDIDELSRLVNEQVRLTIQVAGEEIELENKFIVALNQDINRMEKDINDLSQKKNSYQKFISRKDSVGIINQINESLVAIKSSSDTAKNVTELMQKKTISFDKTYSETYRSLDILIAHYSAILDDKSIQSDSSYNYVPMQIPIIIPPAPSFNIPKSVNCTAIAGLQGSYRISCM